MKQLLIRFFILLSVSTIMLNAGTSFDIYSASEEAKRINKPIMFVVVSATCNYCQLYMNDTVAPSFKNIRRNFVFALSDLTKGDKIPSNLPFNNVTPTTYFLSPNGDLLTQPIEGNFTKQHLEKVVNMLYQAYGNK